MKKLGVVLILFLVAIFSTVLVAKEIQSDKRAMQEIEAEEHKVDEIKTEEIQTTEYMPIELQIEGMFNENYSLQELFELAAVIADEARGEDDETQRAVGSVVLNRVDNIGFPNDIISVIHQDKQYEGAIKGKLQKYIDVYVNDAEISEEEFEEYERYLENAMYLLEEGRTIPIEYVYQSTEKLGDNCIKIGSEWFGTEKGVVL